MGVCGSYQLAGSVRLFLKKQAWVGSPMSSIWLLCALKNPGGGSLGIGAYPTAWGTSIFASKSGRTALIDAARL